MSGPTLLFMHGLGATSGVWADVIAELDWPGEIINVDLPGHGLGPTQTDYTMGALAAGVASRCENKQEVIAVGHSLGGCVALCLASGFFRPIVTSAIAVGIKIRWTDADIEVMSKVAAKGVRWFNTREEAVDRFLRQAGLVGVVEHDHPAVITGVVEEDGRWRVTQDPLTFAQRPVDTAGLLNAAQCPVILGGGEHDSMVTLEDMRAHVENPRIAAGCGHNVQVEDPAWFASLINQVAK